MPYQNFRGDPELLEKREMMESEKYDKKQKTWF